MKSEVRRGRKFVEYHDPETQDEFTFTQEISGADVSYQETDGSWHPADENWATDGVDGFVLKNDKLNHKIRLKGNGGRTWYPRRNVNTEYMTFGVPQYWNGKRWANFSFSGWSVEGKTITLNTRQGVTILVHNRWDGIKIDWVLASSTAPSRMRYPVSLTGITYVDGIIYGADGTRLGQLMPTTATDANGAELVCSGSYAGGYVEFQADVSGAVYPVTIDPDFSVGSAGGDTWLRSGLTYNYGSSTVIQLYADKSRVGLIRFILSSIPSSATCTAAVMSLHSTKNSTLSVYKITDANGDWIEGTATGYQQTGSPCWSYKVFDTVAWAGSEGMATAGTDYIDTNLVSSSFTSPTYTLTFNTDGKTVLQDWFGDATNNGFLIHSSGYVFDISSREDDTESYRPVLTVTYTTGSSGALRRTNMNAQMSNLTGGMHG